MGSILVTGTDTGVGKTFVTYNMALALREAGVKVACFKPVETGVEDLPLDGKLLASATGQNLEEVVPVRYRLPLSPYSAQLEGEEALSLTYLRERFEELRERYDVVLVEGAGGIAVPLTKGYTYANLAADWGLELVIVARAGLGTLNHTFLTVFYAGSMGLRIRGVVLNRFSGADPSERTNPLVVEEMTGFKPVCLKESADLLLTAEERRSLLELVGL